MILATDVQYTENSAVAAAILFRDWEKNEVDADITKRIEHIESYEPGAFYKRELPCILSLLKDVDATIDLIVIDGYVTLGRDHLPGLGAYLYHQLDATTPVIGVAKSKFVDTPQACEVLRGKSQKPLFVTAAGLPMKVAKQRIKHMHGNHRIPSLLKRVDQLCRGFDPSTAS